MCACFWRGEDRLAKNRETCHKGKVISYHAVSEEWFLLSSLALPSLEQLIEKEQILELMGDSQKKDSPSGKKADFKRVK